MADQRSAVYRGATRQDAERSYHAEARTAVQDGYVPMSEEWSTALGQQILTVTYVYAPDQAPAVLEALSGAEAEAQRPSEAALPTASAPIGQVGHAGLAGGMYELETLRMKLIIGRLAGIAAGLAIWWFLVGPNAGDNILIMLGSPFVLAFLGLWLGQMATLAIVRGGR